MVNAKEKITLTKETVTEWLKLNVSELKDILEEITDEIDVCPDDIPESLKENIVDDWFEQAHYSDVSEKVARKSDPREVVRELLDEI